MTRYGKAGWGIGYHHSAIHPIQAAIVREKCRVWIQRTTDTKNTFVCSYVQFHSNHYRPDETKLSCKLLTYASCNVLIKVGSFCKINRLHCVTVLTSFHTGYRIWTELNGIFSISAVTRIKRNLVWTTYYYYTSYIYEYAVKIIIVVKKNCHACLIFFSIKSNIEWLG